MRYINFDNKLNQWLILLLLAFIWGSSFILMKRGLESYSYFQVGTFRLFFSFLLYFPLIVYNFKRLSFQNVKWLLVVGFLGNGIPAILFSMAQTQISSLLSGMLNSLTPVFVLIVSTFLFKSKTNARSVLGTLIGLLGAISLLWFSSKGDGKFSNNINYALLVVLATTFYAVSINVTKHKLKALNGVEISSLAFLFIGPLSGMYLGFSDFAPALQTPNYLQNITFVFILALFSSFIAVIIFNVLVKHTEPVFASSVTYIIPIFAIAWGIFDDETINFFQIASIFIIFIGIYFINTTTKITIKAVNK